jgi:hypothetical protein
MSGDMLAALQEEWSTAYSAFIDVQAYVMIYGVAPGEDRLVDVQVDGRGLTGWASFRHGFIPAWCNWEWEEVGLCRPLCA